MSAQLPPPLEEGGEVNSAGKKRAFTGWSILDKRWAGANRGGTPADRGHRNLRLARPAVAAAAAAADAADADAADADADTAVADGEASRLWPQRADGMNACSSTSHQSPHTAGPCCQMSLPHTCQLPNAWLT